MRRPELFPRCPLRAAFGLALGAACRSYIGFDSPAHADDRAAEGTPSAVVLAGTFQTELGCISDWDPACNNSGLTYDAADGVWQATYALPAGSWEFLAALNHDWTENYGQHATPGGANIQLPLAAPDIVKFYYSDATHWITHNRESVIAVVPGSLQSEAGCPGDWDPSCLRTWLQDIDGDGIHHLALRNLPAGNFECKVAINESWDENYGLGGVPNGANIPFGVPVSDYKTDFEYDSVTHILTVTSSLFSDGFESGQLGAWSGTSPAAPPP